MNFLKMFRADADDRNREMPSVRIDSRDGSIWLPHRNRSFTLTNVPGVSQWSIFQGRYSSVQPAGRIPIRDRTLPDSVPLAWIPIALSRDRSCTPVGIENSGWDGLQQILEWSSSSPSKRRRISWKAKVPPGTGGVAAPSKTLERRGRGGQSGLTTPSALSKVASRYFLDAHPPLLS